MRIVSMQGDVICGVKRVLPLKRLIRVESL